MAKRESQFARDKRLLRQAARSDREALRQTADEMTAKRDVPQQEQLTRYMTGRDDPMFWREEFHSRLRAVGQEKPLAVQRAAAQVALYAVSMEKLAMRKSEVS